MSTLLATGLLVLLVSLLPYTTALRGEGFTTESETEASQRELFFNFNLNQYCENVEVFPFELYECDCQSRLVLPRFSYRCYPIDRQPLCPLLSANLVCGVPEFRFGISWLSFLRLLIAQSPVVSELCYSDVTFGGSELFGPFNEFCFDLANPLQPFSGPFSGLNTFFAPISADSSTSVSFCSAKLDGEKCEMCESCSDSEGRAGFRFSCMGGLISSGDTCSIVATSPLPTQLPDSADPKISLVAPELRHI